MKPTSTLQANTDLLRRLLYDVIIAADNPAELTEWGEGIAVVRFPENNARAVLVAYDETQGNAVYGQLRRIYKIGGGNELEVVLIGGPPTLQALIRKARPKLTRTKIRSYHYADDESLWTATPSPFQDPPLFGSLKAFEPKKQIHDEEWKAFQKKATTDLETGRQQATEVRAFAHRMRGQNPIATKCLLAVFALFFVGELLMGGATSTPTLVRMGALVPSRVWDGEWWRLISCTFLHHGYMHLLFNGFVIYVLGSSLERLVGSTRFLFTYGCAAVAGSVASLFFMGGALSVGASGALWGLLGAEAVLGFYPRNLVPESAIPAIKKTALTNLGLNLIYSLPPPSDIAAQFGGGLMGAFLFLTGIATFGLPRLSHESSEKDSLAQETLPKWLQIAAAVVVGVFAISLATACIQGKPWTLVQNHKMQQHQLREVDHVVNIPDSLTLQDVSVSGDKRVAYVFGSVLVDPVMVSLSFSQYAPISLEQLKNEAEVLRSTIAKNSPKDIEPLALPKMKKKNEHYIVTASFRMANGILFLRRIRLTSTGVQEIDVLLWPQFQDRYNHLSQDILASLASDQ